MRAALLIPLIALLLLVVFVARRRFTILRGGYPDIEEDVEIKFSDFYRLDGTIDRGGYFLIGFVLFAVKHNIDRVVSSYFFGESWELFRYLWPGDISGLGRAAKGDITLFACLLLISLPFIWCGVALTIRRLRAIAAPLWLVALFFVPVVNLVFFLLLSAIPSQATSVQDEPGIGALQRFLDRLIPRSELGSASMALGIMLILGILAAAGSVVVFESYGTGLFVGLPFCLGLGASVLHGYHQVRSLGSCISVALLSVGILGAGMIVAAVEGVLCLLMAAPLAAVLAVLGGLLGYFLQKRTPPQETAAATFGVLLLLVPALLGWDYQRPPELPVLKVDSVVEINAKPEQIWKHVVSFSKLPAPEDWLFRTGIAYPLYAEIDGTGPGAVRRCVFSTGAFVEPIEVWDEPRLLRFGVTEQPQPMHEWSPYDIEPAHLDNYFQSTRGQFLLEPLGENRTRLIGTTWYRHKIAPRIYWRLWSDFIIHRIHLRVLKHIKRRAEVAQFSAN